MSDKDNGFFSEDEFPENWKEEWKDMPEFKHDDMTSYRSIVVHFKNKEDIEEFSKLIRQRITRKQPSLWFPRLKIRTHCDKRYIDES